MDDSPELSVQLFRLETPEVRATVTASIKGDGDLEVFAYDIGSLTERTFGDSDYERATTVAGGDKDALLLALLKDRFSGNSAYSEFGDFCQANDIPTGGWSWS